MSIRVVYDTMLFLQAASQPQRVHTSMQAVRDGRLKLCVSAALIAEICDVLTRPELQATFPALTSERAIAFVHRTVPIAELIDPVPAVFTWPTHPDDVHVFNLAIASGADYLATWERRILAPEKELIRPPSCYDSTPPKLQIITPKDLADRLRPTSD